MICSDFISIKFKLAQGFLLAILLSFFTMTANAADFTANSHDLYVNSSGDIYLKARNRIVLIHGDITIPIVLEPIESDYLLLRNTSENDGYSDVIVYDTLYGSMDLSGYTLYSGLDVSGTNLIIPQVGAIPVSFILVGDTDIPYLWLDLTSTPIEITTPTGLQASYNVNPHGLTISWAAISGATSYDLARSLDEGTSWDESYYSGAEPSFLDSDIDEVDSLYYRVRACNNICSDWSATPSSAQ